MATTYPGAKWDPLGPQTASRMSAHDIVCLHTMAGSMAGTDAMFHEGGYRGTESHFGLAGSGYLEQWQDLDYRADANYQGNHRIISIETADRGENFPAWSGSNVPPWTPAQLDKIVALVRWLCDHYNIPKALVPDSRPGRRGIAYHRQGIKGNFPPPYTGWKPGGELWSTGEGKPCPGDARIGQLINIVIPRVRGVEEDEMDIPDLRGDLGDKRKTSRQLVKEIATGAGVDALRERTEAHPEYGAWRGLIEQATEEAAERAVRKVLREAGLLPEA